MEIPPEIGTEWIFVDYVVGFHLVAFAKKIFKGVLGNKKLYHFWVVNPEIVQFQICHF